MLQSQINTEGSKIIKDIFSEVVQSNNKDLWLHALKSTNNHIARLIATVKATSARNTPDANFQIRNQWYWESARRQLYKKYAYKFL